MQTEEPEHSEDTKGPWAWPRWMLGEILTIHDDLADLAIKGLTRRAASALARWLWSIEAIVRRLLLAAAFALTLAPVSRAAPSPRKPAARRQPEPEAETNAETPELLRSSFRTFSIRRAGRGTAFASGRAFVPRPDMGALPLDPLLRLGADHLRPRKRAVSSFRRSRSTAQSYEDYLAYGPNQHPPRQRSRPNPNPQRDPGSAPRPRHFDGVPNPFNDPRRRPAPMLARRISALVRVLEHPEAAARRLASLLARHAAAPFASAGCPSYTRGKSDILPRPPGVMELSTAHDIFLASVPAPDSS